MRVVSLIPSATEILGHIGADDLLVGRSHECDAPARVLDRPALTAARTRYDPDAGVDARAIDEGVRGALGSGDLGGAGLSLYALDADALAALKPDLIITQDMCSVCSIDAETVRRACAALPSGPEVLMLNPASVENILDDVTRVARAVGRERDGRRAAVALAHRMDRAMEHVNPYDDGPVCGFMEWTDPVFCAGHWSVQLIERAGARHPLNPTQPVPGSGAAVGPQQAQRLAGASIAVEPEDFEASAPEWLVVAPCGLTLDQADRAFSDMRASAPWVEGLPAVRAGRVAIVDGNEMFNRPGPRVVEALEFLVGWLNGRPELIPDGFPWRVARGPGSAGAAGA